MISYFVLLAFLFVPSWAARSNFGMYAQDSKAAAPEELARGIELYKQGEAKEAAKVLRSATKSQKENIEAWFYLGLALTRSGNLKDARKAYETTLKLNPRYASARTGLAWNLAVTGKLDKAEEEINRVLTTNNNNAEAHFILGTIYLKKSGFAQALAEAEQAVRLNPEYGLAHLLQSQVILAIYSQKYEVSNPASHERRKEYFDRAAVSLEEYLKYTKDEDENDMWREQLASLQLYAGAPNEDNKLAAFTAQELIQKAVILRKQEPSYTENARQAGVEGTVVLLAVLASDGVVKHILAVKSLPYGLTRKCIEVARKIKFEPAMRDGRAVSQFVRIEYNFNMY